MSEPADQEIDAKRQLRLVALEAHPGGELLDAAISLYQQTLSEEDEERYRELLATARSRSTIRAYRQAIRYWEVWHSARFGADLPLPTPHEAIVAFVVDHSVTANDDPVDEGEATSEEGRKTQRAKRGSALFPSPMRKRAGGKKVIRALEDAGFAHARYVPAEATLKLRVAALAFLNNLWAAQTKTVLNNPAKHPAVLEALRAARVAAAMKRRYPKRKAPVTSKLLSRLLETTKDDLVGKRDRAMLLVGLALGGMRRANIADLRIDDLEPKENGNFQVRNPYTKTMTNAAAALDATLPLAGAAARALREWLDASGVTKGRIFRSLQRRVRKTKAGKEVYHVVGEALSPGMIYRRVRELAVAAGINLDRLDLGAHSLRAGFMTESSLKGIPIEKAMKFAGRVSYEVAMTYYRVTLDDSDKAAHIFDDAV